MKHILITGSTDGIGKLLALRLAKEGHFVAIHGRSDAKLAATLKEIKKQSNNENVIGFLADFSNVNAVKKMAEEVAEKMPVIDVLVNNAGVLMTNSNSGATDIRFVVNYFAPYVLTNGLLPNIKASKTARIVNLSSAAQSTINLQALEGKTALGANEAYAQSKLALTMWSFYLAEQEPLITVVAVNPGSLLNTKMAKEAYGQHWSPADKGVDILYDLSMTDLAKTGQYFDNDKGSYATAHADAYNSSKIEELVSLNDNIIL
ncbi:short subunit dehydrogenase [Flavobacteriaceae bacterium MAR_2009_75]|nr:short subunit dehydrogenase [Flavobacteriaceae bacterium MAR_2009_75]PKB00575.1 short subunit dehydrogenase [Flavobacteriaceae bacterium MAR_2009_75]